MTQLLNVSVWEKLPGSGTGYGKVGELATWTAVEVEPRFFDPGTWSLDMPLDAQAAALTKTHLLTFDLPRGTAPAHRLLTGVIDKLGKSAGETGKPVVAASGYGALGLLGGYTCWPTTGSGIGAQAAYYTTTGAAETMLRNLILANVVTRQGDELAIPTSLGRGSTITLNERFTNLLEAVRKAENAGLGLRMGLVNTSSSTRAEMRLEFTPPVDRSARVRLSHKVGTLRSWSQVDEAPTATRAIVAGSGEGAARILRLVIDTAAEAEWGLKKELFVDQRETSSTTELDALGLEALAEATGKSSFDLESVEAEGLRFGTHYDLGDTVTVDLLTGTSTTETLRAVKVSAGDNGITIQLIPGHPDAGNPLLAQAALVRNTRRRVGALERKES